MYTKKMSFLLSTPLSTHSCFHRQDRNYYLHIRNFSNHIYWNSYLLLISILWFSSFKFKMPANWMISKNINHKMQFYWSWWNLNFGTGFSFYQPSIILNNFEQTQDWESSDMKCLHLQFKKYSSNMPNIKFHISKNRWIDIGELVKNTNVHIK